MVLVMTEVKMSYNEIDDNYFAVKVSWVNECPFNVVDVLSWYVRKYGFGSHLNFFRYIGKNGEDVIEFYVDSKEDIALFKLMWL